MNGGVSQSQIYFVRPRPNLEVQFGDADCGVSPGHPRGLEGIQLKDADSYTVERMSPGPLWESSDWVGATFGDPRTPAKAQRRLGGLQIDKNKAKDQETFPGQMMQSIFGIW